MPPKVVPRSENWWAYISFDVSRDDDTDIFRYRDYSPYGLFCLKESDKLNLVKKIF